MGVVISFPQSTSIGLMDRVIFWAHHGSIRPINLFTAQNIIVPTGLESADGCSNIILLGELELG